MLIPPVKPTSSVDDDDLAMVAVVEVPDFRRLDRIHRPELADLDVLPAQLVEELARRLAAAEAVVQHSHFDAFLALLRQQIGESLPDVAGAEDEGLDVNVVARRSQCRLDGGVGLRPVDEDADAIAGRERRRRVAANRVDQLADGCIVLVLFERSLQNLVAGVLGQLALSRDDRRHLLGRLDARILRDARCAQNQGECDPPCKPHQSKPTACQESSSPYSRAMRTISLPILCLLGLSTSVLAADKPRSPAVNDDRIQQHITELSKFGTNPRRRREPRCVQRRRHRGPRLHQEAHAGSRARRPRRHGGQHHRPSRRQQPEAAPDPDRLAHRLGSERRQLRRRRRRARRDRSRADPAGARHSPASIRSKSSSSRTRRAARSAASR